MTFDNLKKHYGQVKIWHEAGEGCWYTYERGISTWKKNW